jgi:hypothetical protein
MFYLKFCKKSNDYENIQNLFKRMNQKNFFYMSKSAKEIIKTTNPKFINIYEYKKCIRDLKYVGLDNKNFKNDKIYKSTHYNGATYKIIINSSEVTVGSDNFERLS